MKHVLGWFERIKVINIVLYVHHLHFLKEIERTVLALNYTFGNISYVCLTSITKGKFELLIGIKNVREFFQLFATSVPTSANSATSPSSERWQASMPVSHLLSLYVKHLFYVKHLIYMKHFRTVGNTLIVHNIIKHWTRKNI